jgi:ATP-dependent DNA helicase DinG
MKTEYVVIDTETTGFDAKNCAIIEIAAVKWDKGLIKEGFTSLINPGQPIPEEISDITGITDEMVKEQPLIQDVIPRLEKFIGDAVLVAHNAPFDKSFMDNVWSLENQWLDSITLAQIVFPTAGTYSLGFLCQYLGIENTDAHRSLSDTKATAELFGRSLQELAALSWPIKRELLEMVKDDESALGRLIYRECKKDPQVDEKEPWDSVVLTAKPATKESVPRQRVVNEEYLLNLKEIEKYLTSDELCGQHIADFEPRQQQLEMSQAVAEAFNLQNFLLAEAGTGTGKSLAYLLPAALFALHSGQPVVISTHTINLQEQLIKKDIPQLKAILKEEFKAAVIKGRSHYLCLNLLKHYVLHGDDELRYFIMRLLVWASQTSTGDSGELGLNRFERWKWQRLSASRENCVAPNCSYCRAGCFVFQSRRKAETADIIIVNHSLLVANAGLETAILPDFSYLIIDEAHHLQRDAEEQLTGVVDFYELIKGLGRLKKKRTGQNRWHPDSDGKASAINICQSSGARAIFNLLEPGGRESWRCGGCR